MQKKIVYEIKALYRDHFRVTGFSFGSGEQSMCIVGSMRGNENQQLYTCSQLIRKLSELEDQGKLVPGHEILVIPCVNPYSINIKKRFWPTDNTDINRMFPGYSEGETTQRIADGLFKNIKDFKYGIQFASFYRPGIFLPHVRIMKTGFEDLELAKQFRLPYVRLADPRPFDTATLNYNWQIWETDAFSIYTTHTRSIDKESANLTIEAILHFMDAQNLLEYKGYQGVESRLITNSDERSVRTMASGFFEPSVQIEDKVVKGQEVARILDTYLGDVKHRIYAPCSGTVSFIYNDAMAYQNSVVMKLIKQWS